ncbi:MAG: fumarate reductase (quinol) flavoprotein subunit [Gemmatimonadota bacterium]|nr:fumarate reductase (quinol) flavoprotein subunit [Gemmatimonadota bacterium]MDE2870830.1 fumarate reductase (quinol) flavoprotein subunit [Gemmatimonadota bacterium]
MAHGTTHQHDVVIIGGGGAGLRASIAIAEENPSFSVACVSKVYPMRSHTVTAEGGAAAKIKPNDSLEDHIYDTISGADWLADQDAVEYFVNEAPAEMIQLEHWGCPWSREGDGSVAVRPFGGMKIERTWFAADKTGFHMLHSLFQTTLKYGNIVRYDEHFATRLLIDAHGRCRGCAAIELLTGRVRAILGKAVIICTGGAGRVFPFTTNGSIKTGDGMAMAYRAGVALKDMEFIQYHPTGLPGTGILITEASRGEGGILVNRDGYRYLQDYDLGEALDVTDPRHPQKRAMELGPRDRLSQCFIKEMWAGRTIETRDGHVVHLDLRHLGEAKIDRKIPFVRELSRNYAGIDPVHKPIPVRPVVHYVMGGIDVGGNSATSVPGLYAAGECACVSINGANRLGSNSLTELLVFGAQAGRHAARFAMDNPGYDVAELEAQAEDEGARIRRTWFDPSRTGGERIATLRTELHDAMEDGAGIYRDAESLQAACDKVAELRERYGNVTLDDRTHSFNTELTAALELGSLLDVAEAMAHSGLERTESRGSHQRLDHTERNDDDFLAHSLAFRREDGGPPRIEYGPVTITKWPPGARTYGAESGLKRPRGDGT